MTWVARAAFAAALLCLTAPAHAAEIEPKIRDFDLATTERLGREMYEQDQWAWKATDVLVEKRSESERTKEGLAGWITGRVDGKPVVRFVGKTDSGVQALYDVVFEDGKAPVFSTPADRALTAEEIGQHEARRLALKGAANKCSDRYNTVALKDPEGDGWLVWAMAATTDDDAIIIGGHFRFTISPDGKSVRARDALSKGCLRFSKRAMKGGGSVAGLLFSHLVSLAPVETYVFASLAYEVPMYVGMLNGGTWKLEQGRLIAVDMDSAGADGFAARTLAGFAEKCMGIATKPNEQPQKFYTIDNLPPVILETEKNEAFAIEVPGEFNLVSIMCGRLDIVPAPNDYKVVVAGYPLYIIDTGVGHPKRMGVLELSGGQFRFRMQDGSDLTDDVAARVGRRLDAFQTAVQAKTVKQERDESLWAGVMESASALRDGALLSQPRKVEASHLVLQNPVGGFRLVPNELPKGAGAATR